MSNLEKAEREVTEQKLETGYLIKMNTNVEESVKYSSKHWFGDRSKTAVARLLVRVACYALRILLIVSIKMMK